MMVVKFSVGGKFTAGISFCTSSSEIQRPHMLIRIRCSWSVLSKLVQGSVRESIKSTRPSSSILTTSYTDTLAPKITQGGQAGHTINITRTSMEATYKYLQFSFC
ncbi:hypothetical protein BJ165DRAFT_1467894 [Panaeolus papilionaceus]|nr:hypothetical protein BJ165DRAFT_1467894 [Panaeolus papilionaceus]